MSIEFVENNLLSNDDLGRLNPKRHTLAERMKEWWVPGVSIAVIKAGSIEWARGYGVCEAGKPEPVGAETLFQSGSISKSIAALAALRLVEQGKLNLDADVNDYLKSWKVPPVDGWQPRVTLRQLLSHTGATTVHGFLGYAVTAPLPSLTQILDGLPPATSAPIRVAGLPGVQFNYSGGGTTIMQQMVMDVTGEAFEDTARRLVFEPLGMTRSTYQQPLPTAYHGNTATGHYQNGTPIVGRWEVMPQLAAAGLWTTPTDIARFAIAIWNAYHGKDSMISQQVARWMLPPQAGAKRGDAQVGLGVFLRDDGAYFGHGGDNVGYKNTFGILMEHGDGLAIMANGDQGEGLIEEIRRAIAESLGWKYFVAELKTSGAESSHLYDAYAGEYELYPDFTFKIYVSEAALFFETERQPSLKLVPISETEFALHTLNATLTFEPDEDGKVDALTFTQRGNATTALRL